MRRTITVAVVFLSLLVAAAFAKVAAITLAELAQDAEFIGVVRVDHVGGGVPLLRRPRATATILQSWKGQAQGKVTFVAAAAWTCDISDAKAGEEAVVFIRDGNLEHSGRGRMPIFIREGRRLAALWPDVRLPKDVATEAGPSTEYDFVRGVAVIDLRSALASQAK